MLNVLPNQLATVRQLLALRLPHVSTVAFGSRVVGWPFGKPSKPFSDLDIALGDLGPNDDVALAHLRADFEESNLPWRVDLTDAKDLSATLHDLVVAHGVSLIGKSLGEVASSNLRGST
jgi:uncharacterized protein